MSKVVRKIILWGGVLLLQLLLLFYIRPLEGFVPYIYILLLIGLPLKISRVKLLWASFFLGLFIDIFCNSFGIHAFSSVFIMYMLPGIVGVFANTYGDETVAIHPACIGWLNYIVIVGILMLVYHFVVIFLWYFSIDGFWQSIQVVFFSSALSLLLSIVITILSIPPKENING